MSRAGWERQALNSIQSVLGHTDPKLTSLLATFSRLASSEEMPAHERVRSPLRHPSYRRRSRRRRVPPCIWNLRRLAPGEGPRPGRPPGRRRTATGHPGSGLAAIRYDPQDTQPSDIDLWQRETTVRGRAGKPGRPLSPRRP